MKHLLWPALPACLSVPLSVSICICVLLFVCLDTDTLCTAGQACQIRPTLTTAHTIVVYKAYWGSVGCRSVSPSASVCVCSLWLQIFVATLQQYSLYSQKEREREKGAHDIRLYIAAISIHSHTCSFHTICISFSLYIHSNTYNSFIAQLSSFIGFLHSLFPLFFFFFENSFG